MTTVLPSLKDLLKGRVKFSHYQNGELWYFCEDYETFLFPVPISDTNEAKFLAEDKAMLFMRWIKARYGILEFENKNNT